MLAHDAAHNTLTSSKKLNWLLAVLSLMPGFFNYRLWCWDHHLLHHPWPNGDYADAFKPPRGRNTTPCPRTGGFCSGSPQFLGIGLRRVYTLERWLKVKLWPREGVPAKLRASAWKHFAFLLLYGESSTRSWWRRRSTRARTR